MTRTKKCKVLAGPVVSFVVAAARNGIIGRQGDMPWCMPSSLKRFRALTMGRPMIMGRKTYEAIGRPLEGRDSVVISRSAAYRPAGAHVVASLEEAFVLAARLATARGTNEIIIAGGGETYLAALPYATHIHLDRIETEVGGDAAFPELDPAEWEEIERRPIDPSPRDQFRALAILFRRIGSARPIPSA